MKKVFNSLIAVILVITMIVPSITVFAATDVPYKKTGTVYTISGKSYYQAQTTSDYNGVGKGTLFWVDSSSDIITDRDKIAQLTLVNKYNIAIESDPLFIANFLDSTNGYGKASKLYFEAINNSNIFKKLAKWCGTLIGTGISFFAKGPLVIGDLGFSIIEDAVSPETIKTMALTDLLRYYSSNTVKYAEMSKKALTTGNLTEYDTINQAVYYNFCAKASWAAFLHLAGDEITQYSSQKDLETFFTESLNGLADSVIPDIPAVEIAKYIADGTVSLVEFGQSSGSEKVYQDTFNSLMANTTFNVDYNQVDKDVETAKKLAKKNSSSSTSTKYSTGTYKPSEWDGLNMRSGAATSYSKVGAIAAGTNFVVTQINGIWGKTTCNGVTGWVCLDYATKVSSSTTTTPAKKSYEIDVNGHINGNYKTSLNGYATFDVYINGSRVKNDVGDFSASYIDGTAYEIKDIKAKSGYEYVSGEALSGKISGGKVWVYVNVESSEENEDYNDSSSLSSDSIIAHMKSTYAAALNNAKMPSFDGWCGECVGQQLKVLGINTGAKITPNGNDTYSRYASMSKTSGGFTVNKYPVSSYSLKQALNLLNNSSSNYTYAVLGFETGENSEDGQKYGHTLLIYAVKDGFVYYTESFVPASESSECVKRSINNFCNTYSDRSSTTAIEYKYDGMIYFSKDAPAKIPEEEPTVETPSKDTSSDTSNGWTEWSTTKPESKEYRTIESKTQYGYYHYVHKWTDTGFTGAYPVKDYKVFTNDPTDILNYHEYWSDSKLSDDGSPWIGGGKSYKCYPNKCCSLGSNVSTTGRNLYDLGKTRTVYRYKDEEPETYTIKYNANGGSGAPSSQTKTHGDSIKVSAQKPTRSGYEFDGWATSANGNVEYDPSESYTKDSDITLYAVWEANTYTISYNANGGSGAPKNQTKKYDESIKLSTQEPTREDYIFLGWSTSADGSVEFAPGSVCSVNENITLYALWQEEENEVYYVIYNANGGKNAPSMQTKNEDEDITISNIVPSREGYTFDGWAVGDNDTVVYSSGDTYKDNKTLYLHAVWTANTYTISYDANGGFGAPRNQSKVHDESITLSAVVPEKEDCMFIGWSDHPYAEYAKYYAEDTFTKNSDTVLYAVWEEIIEEDKEAEEANDDKNQSQNEIPFEDVPEDAWYRKDVENAYKNGLINGKSEKRYAPNDNMTYAEAIKLACTIYQLYYDGEVTLTNGSDVWYSTYMDYALENRIVRTDYSSVANEYVTRKGFVNIFYGALPLKEFAKINNVEDNIIPDVKIGDAYSGEIYTFYRAGILTGNDAKGTFKPDSNISRSEVAAIVTRMLDGGARKETSF